MRKKFPSAAECKRSASDLDLARLWRRVPWAFVAFEAIERAEHQIVLISPIGPPPAGWPSDLF